uniref:cytosolic Fe-S cluster assembly factor NUBP2 n=1 Tax=Myxine glutinosa TaxID=7769 RepID=UPI00358F7A01
MALNSDGLQKRVRCVLLVLSGKGGVGKSSVSVQLALSFLSLGKKVGLLDADLCGPSIPLMIGAHGKNVQRGPDGWLPVRAGPSASLSLMSVAFLLSNKDDAIVWRGPKKTAMIKQFLSDVQWGDLDILIVDTPPGTSDEHLAVLEGLRGHPVYSAVLVTTPQAVSVGDVRRELTFCHKTGTKVLGIVENMSGFVCPHCAECTNIFSQGGGESLAKECDIRFLGSVPLDPSLALTLDKDRDFSCAATEGPAEAALRHIAEILLKEMNEDANVAQTS